MMPVRLILDDIVGMVICSSGQSLVKIKGAERLLVDEEGFGLLPGAFTLDGLVMKIIGELHIDLINEGGQLFFDEAHVVLRILPREVEILEHLMAGQRRRLHRIIEYYNRALDLVYLNKVMASNIMLIVRESCRGLGVDGFKLLQFLLACHQSGDYLYSLRISCCAEGRYYGVSDHSHYVRILDSLDVEVELIDDLPPYFLAEHTRPYLILRIVQYKLEDLHDLEVVHLWQQQHKVLEH